ncbi:MAG: hypothetical protein HQ564_03075 [Candidatus Saganbacteria bacterium]|nr:hypothetical protein [Candidatus Saganbacteria bacterium]
MAIIELGKPWGLYGVRYVQRRKYKEFGRIAPQAVFSLDNYRNDLDLFLSHLAIRIHDIRRRFEMLGERDKNLFGPNRPMLGSLQAVELLSDGQFLVLKKDQPLLQNGPFSRIVDSFERVVFDKKEYVLVTLKDDALSEVKETIEVLT